MHALLNTISLVRNHKTAGIHLDVNDLRNWDTSLSPSSQDRLLCGWETSSLSLKPDGYLPATVGNYIEQHERSDFLGFAKAVLKPLAKSTVNFLDVRCSNLESFKAVFECEINWSQDEASQLMIFDLYTKGEFYLSLLLGVSVLERLLGDAVFTYYKGDASKIPFLIRDLLSIPCLEEMLGNELNYILIVLIGPPSTLNLRNILWHGFISPLELYPSPGKELSSLVLMLYIWVTRRLMHSEVLKGENLRRRKGLGEDFGRFFELQQGHDKLDIRHDFNNSWEHFMYSKARPPLYSADTLEQLASETAFFPYGTQSTIISSIRYMESDPLLFFMLSIPTLEHSLRRLYISINPLVRKEKLLTSEDEFFLIMDNILAETIEDEFLIHNSKGPIINLLFDELGHGVMNLMLDLFDYPAGPRLRDRISHGEGNYLLVQFSKFEGAQPIYEGVVHHYAALLAYLMQKYTVPFDGDDKDKFQSQLSGLDFNWMIEYTPRFHSLAIAEKKFGECFVLLYFVIKTNAKYLQQKERDNTCRVIESHILEKVTNLVMMNPVFFYQRIYDVAMEITSVDDVVQMIVTAWRDGEEKSKYRKITGMHRRIFGTVQSAMGKLLEAFILLYTTSENFQSGDEYNISSRKRKQANQFREYLPALVQQLCCSLLIFEMLLHDKHQWIVNIQEHLPVLLKELLVFSERLAGFARQGRWVEITGAFKGLAKQILRVAGLIMPIT